MGHDDSIPASEWDYRTIKELTRALQTRKISASELLAHTIARIEALDRRLNAVVVRDFERAREAATAADVALARGEGRLGPLRDNRPPVLCSKTASVTIARRRSGRPEQLTLFCVR
jgi:hypothetical protein